MQTLDDGMKQARLDHVDLWRITCSSRAQHTRAEIEEAVAALDWAKKTGRARFTGFSSHHRPHIKWMIETFPEQIQVIVTPYTADTKVVDRRGGLWAAVKKQDVGWFGIKPFASNSLFKGDSAPDSPTFKEDNRLARLAIRYILCNPAISAPIPGMISAQQVDNVALAVKERRELDLAEQTELKDAMERAWAGLPSRTTSFATGNTSGPAPTAASPPGEAAPPHHGRRVTVHPPAPDPRSMTPRPRPAYPVSSPSPRRFWS